MTVVGARAVAIRSMYDYGAPHPALLHRFPRGRFLGIVVALISSSGTEGREVRHPLSTTERLNVFVQKSDSAEGAPAACSGDFSSGTSRTGALYYSAKLGVTQAGVSAAAMAGVTGQGTCGARRNSFC